ncbi:MAG: hypothetical protein ABID63_04970 [Pseudomonadota bacterium]
MSSIDSLGSSSLAQILASQRTTSSSGIEAIEGISAFDSNTSSGTTSSTDSGTTTAADTALNATEQLSETLKAALLALQESDSGSTTDSDSDSVSSFVKDMFASLDTDADGTLTKEEFLAGKPDDVSDEQAENLWSQIAGSDAQSVDEASFTTAMSAPPAPPASSDDSSSSASGGGSSSSSSENYDPLDTNKDGVVSLEERMAGNGSGEDQSGLGTKVMAQLMASLDAA